MIPGLIISFISFIIFRIDEFIFRSSPTEILTRITSEIVVNILLAWELVIIILLIGLITILYKNKRLASKDRKRWFYFLGIPIFLLIFTLVANISHFPFTVIDSVSLVFYQPQDIVRIDIIQDCSGIYGILIFSCSFLLFGANTKRNVEWDKKHTLLLFFGGLVGVYFLNILRILAVINACLSTDIVLKSFIHSYLGSILILLFVVSYWALIWKNAFKRKGKTNESIDA
jgi:exosortase/archaeosortase family protein